MKLGIQDVNLTNTDKSTCMKIFVEACHKKNEENLEAWQRGNVKG